MKVLIDLFGPPFFLAHGGAQIQVNETFNGLRECGIDVEYAKWWDGKQSADIIHSFGVPPSVYQTFARTKNIRVVNTTLFTATCNRGPAHLAIQGAMISAMLKLPGIPPLGGIRAQLTWGAFRTCDMNIVGLKAEANVLKKVYGVLPSHIALAPLGLARPFLEAGHGQREKPYLITTGTITERKQSLELARMAHLAKVPVCFVGKPYDQKSAYWKSFQSLVDGKNVIHIPHTESIHEMIRLLQGSKGYILFSDYENWCLSAHEAIACGLPILVPDQQWSRELFGTQAQYFSGWNIKHNAKILSSFYANCESIAAPNINLYSWKEVAENLVQTYSKILNT